MLENVPLERMDGPAKPTYVQGLLKEAVVIETKPHLTEPKIAQVIQLHPDVAISQPDAS